MIEDVNDAERFPRSLTLHFCAPATGEVDLRTEIVRTGKRVTHAACRIENEKGVATLGSASFCKDRPGAERYVHARMPNVEPAASLRPLPADVPGIPAFFQHVDARFCGATMPFSSSSSKEAKVIAWVRLREPSPLDAPLASLLLDSLPPAITATFGAPRPLASVDFTIHFFAHLTETDAAPEEHCLVAIGSRWADDGYTEEVRDLWSPRGVLLAQCRQLIALL
jgi:acyl-CoA thioesterase